MKVFKLFNKNYEVSDKELKLQVIKQKIKMANKWRKYYFVSNQTKGNLKTILYDYISQKFGHGNT